MYYLFKCNDWYSNILTIGKNGLYYCQLLLYVVYYEDYDAKNKSSDYIIRITTSYLMWQYVCLIWANVFIRSGITYNEWMADIMAMIKFCSLTHHITCYNKSRERWEETIVNYSTILSNYFVMQMGLVWWLENNYVKAIDYR